MLKFRKNSHFRIRKTIKKTLAALQMAGLVLSLTGLAVSAETTVSYTAALIDETKTGSLTVRKLVSNAGEAEEGTGLADYEPTEDQKPLSGVVFSYIKIADMEQTETDDTVLLSLENINSGFLSLVSTLGLSLPEENVGGNTFVTTDGLQSLVETINETAGDGTSDPGEAALNTWIKDNGTAMPKTDGDGFSSVSNLPLGIYLVAESAVPATR